MDVFTRKNLCITNASVMSHWNGVRGGFMQVFTVSFNVDGTSLPKSCQAVGGFIMATERALESVLDLCLFNQCLSS